MRRGVIIAVLLGVFLVLAAGSFMIPKGEKSSANLNQPQGDSQELLPLDTVDTIDVNEEEEVVESSSEGVVEEPNIINGKTLEERQIEAIKQLHQEDSAQWVRDNFPDIKLVYSDFAEGEGFPGDILPFEYYYSEEAGKTFNLCAIERSVFICNGELTRKVTDAEMDDPEICIVTPIYAEYF